MTIFRVQSMSVVGEKEREDCFSFLDHKNRPHFDEKKAKWQGVGGVEGSKKKGEYK